MAHQIDMTNGKPAIAFLGNRNDIWHRLGTGMKPGQSIDIWAQAAGLNWQAVKVPALASLEGPAFDHLPAGERFRRVDGWNHMVRSDNGYPLGYVSDGYEPVQPRDVLDWFDRYIAVDDRFQLDVAGSLKKGETIWATATYRDKLEIAGDAHVARVLMTTTFDGTGSTINQGTMTRVVCANTLRMALCDKGAVIKTRHSTKFDAKKVGDELAALAKGFSQYKKLGEALAMNSMAQKEIGDFFKRMLDIPAEAKKEDISTKALNNFVTLGDAYKKTVAEGTPKNTAWAALQAITRYVDHDRTVRSVAKYGEDESRLLSSQFGSGDALKCKAWDELFSRIDNREKVLVPA